MSDCGHRKFLAGLNEFHCRGCGMSSIKALRDTQQRLAECEKDIERHNDIGTQLAEACAEEMAGRVAAEQRNTALEAQVKMLREALSDMRSGWRYIREVHGDLYGVGWDRAEKKADTALAATEDKP